MSAPRTEDVAEVLAMVRVLAEVGYRDLSQAANQQRYAVSRRLWREGLDSRILRLLHAYAKECGQNPAGLFAWWIDKPSRTLAKVEEMRRKSVWTARMLDGIKAEGPEREEPAPIRSLNERRRQA